MSIEEKRQEIKLALAEVNTTIGGRNSNQKSFLSPDEITQILTILDSQGVAIKVDRELPEGITSRIPLLGEILDELNFSATEPLIEEAESES